MRDLLTYPQAERTAWANAYADQCGAIWKLCDARRDAALNLLAQDPEGRREELRQRIVQAEEARDVAVARCGEARRVLKAAEAAHYAAVEAGACQPST
jgi:hypothetical protein